MKILNFGGFLSEEQITKYNSLSNADSKISVAAIKYSRLIERGFFENLGSDSEHYFLPTIGMYPSCKVIFSNIRNTVDARYIKFINIIGLKQISIFLNVFLKTFVWAFKNRKHDRVVVFSFIYLPFQAIIPVIKLFFNIKFVSFVPDLPNYCYGYTKNGKGLKSSLLPLFIKLSNYISNQNDYFVFITEYMIEKFARKPYSIIEGLASPSVINNIGQKNNKKTIMYSGALYEKFGLGVLIDAFKGIKEDYELWLFGSGDIVDKINSDSMLDNRIKYFGSVPNSVVMDYQTKAHILINPRFSNEEFTKYSFPSKLIEYSLSGVPVLTTRLKGIPSDYNDKFYFIEDETVIGMRLAIEMVLAKSENELNERGEILSNFVSKEKSYLTQIRKVINDINDVFFK